VKSENTVQFTEALQNKTFPRAHYPYFLLSGSFLNK